MRLAGKVALITGGANGIGRATARRFAAEGAKVVVADRDEAALGGLATGDVTPVVGSVTAADDVARMVEGALGAYGALHILINNAGITRDGLSARLKDGEPRFMPEADWDAVLDVNLKGSWLCSQRAVIPMMAQGYGRIVNTASVAALGNIGQANYAASKAGVIGLTRTLALEWARYGVNVNCVAPGGVETRMTETIPDKLRSALLARLPLGRFANPDEIAAAHLFLASDEASFVTGQVLFVDGGASVGA